MRLSRYLIKSGRDFAASTSITGFSQILRSSNRIESAFWLLSIVAGLALTVRDCSTPIRAYINEDSYTTTSFVTVKSMSFPGASLCVEVDTSKLSIRNSSALEDLKNLECFSACLTNFSCYTSKSFFTLFRDEVFASAVLLSRYSAFESGRDSFIEESNKTIAKVPASFHETLLVSGVGSAQLLDMVGYVLCQAMRFRASHSNHERVTQIEFCKDARVIWFGIPPKTTDETDLLCYDVENLTKVQSVQEGYEIAFHPYDVLERQTDSKYDKTYAYLNLDGAPVSTDLESNAGAYILFEHCSSIYLDMFQRIRLMPKRAKPCDPLESYFRCQARCRVDEFAASCNCSVVSFERYVSDYGGLPSTSCFSKYSPMEYESCAIAVKASRCEKPCSSRCSPPCQVDLLYVINSVCGAEDLREPNETVVTYSLLRMSYSVVQEKAMQEGSSLVSSIGGIVGLWLGAGFIGLLEAAVFFPKVLVNYVLCKHTAADEGEDGRLEAIIQVHLTKVNERLDRLDDIAERVASLEKKRIADGPGEPQL